MAGKIRLITTHNTIFRFTRYEKIDIPNNIENIFNNLFKLNSSLDLIVNKIVKKGTIITSVTPNIFRREKNNVRATIIVGIPFINPFFIFTNCFFTTSTCKFTSIILKISYIQYILFIYPCQYLSILVCYVNYIKSLIEPPYFSIFNRKRALYETLISSYKTLFSKLFYK